jgi:hypothetical protein
MEGKEALKMKRLIMIVMLVVVGGNLVGCVSLKEAESRQNAQVVYWEEYQKQELGVKEPKEREGDSLLRAWSYKRLAQQEATTEFWKVQAKGYRDDFFGREPNRFARLFRLSRLLPRRPLKYYRGIVYNFSRSEIIVDLQAGSFGETIGLYPEPRDPKVRHQIIEDVLSGRKLWEDCRWFDWVLMPGRFHLQVVRRGSTFAYINRWEEIDDEEGNRRINGMGGDFSIPIP